MADHTITDRARIVAMLTCETLAPPQRAGGGATLALRRTMARFSPPSDHRARREAIDTCVERIEVALVTELARHATAHRLVADRADGMALARVVPVAALGAALNLIDRGDHGAAEDLALDLDRVAAVIGRGGSASSESDAATQRLLELAAVQSSVPIECVSLLYQCLDATAALITTTLVAEATGSARIAAVPRTARIALEDVSLVGHTFAAGDLITLEIGPAGMEYGVGPHACPGQRLAEAISSSAIAEIGRARFEVDLRTVEYDHDGRPTKLGLSRM